MPKLNRNERDRERRHERRRQEDRRRRERLHPRQVNLVTQALREAVRRLLLPDSHEGQFQIEVDHDRSAFLGELDGNTLRLALYLIDDEGHVTDRELAAWTVTVADELPSDC